MEIRGSALNNLAEIKEDIKRKRISSYDISGANMDFITINPEEKKELCSIEGAGIIKHFERIERARALIICPKPLIEMWEDYNETFDLNARVLSMSLLRKNGGKGVETILDQRKYRDRNFVLIDESHNFRHHSSQRYEVLNTYLLKGMKKVCLLTATPRNKDAWSFDS